MYCLSLEFFRGYLSGAIPIMHLCYTRTGAPLYPRLHLCVATGRWMANTYYNWCLAASFEELTLIQPTITITVEKKKEMKVEK